MLDQLNATPTPHKRLPWNKGKLTGAKPPLRPKHVWSIRTKRLLFCHAGCFYRTCFLRRLGLP